MRGKKSIKLPIVIYIILCDYRQIVQLEMNKNELHSYTNIQKKNHPFILTRVGFYTKQKIASALKTFLRGLFGYFLSPSNKRYVWCAFWHKAMHKAILLCLFFFHCYFYFTTKQRPLWVRQFLEKNSSTCSNQRAYTDRNNFEDSY